MTDNSIICNCFVHSEEQQKVLTDLLSSYKSIKLTACFHLPSEALEYLNKNKPTIIFMDIEDANFLKCVQHPPFIVGLCEKKYFRNLKKYLSLGFYDFLINPISAEDFHNIMGKILNTHNPNSRRKNEYSEIAAEDEPLYNSKLLEKALFTKESIFLNGNRKKESMRISFDNVEYLNTIKNEVHIHFENGSIKTMKTSLRYFQEKLPKERFQKINKNTIINLDKVTKIMKQDRILVNEKIFKVSRSFKKILLTKLDV